MKVGEAASGLNVILDCVSDIQNFVVANHQARHARNIYQALEYRVRDVK